jgi:hypothetical protein
MERFLMPSPVSLNHRSNNYSNNYGIALVEVLITTVITAVGILAVVLLLSNLTSSSSISKARDEALALAQGKIELFHNNINKAQYLALQSGKEESIKGFNAVFSRQWEVNDEKGPERKVVKVTVSWKDNKNKTESIQLNTIINWNGPAKSASIASYGLATGFVYLSPNQTAKKGDQKEIILPQGAITKPLPYQMKKHTDKQGNILILDSNNHLLLTIYADKEKKERDLLQISGQVYYQGNIQIDLKVLAAEGAYCLFPLESNKLSNSAWEVAKYYCIVAKGWRGKIGTITTRNINNISYCPDRSREYLAYSLSSGKKLQQSGIKQSYVSQDFVLVNNKLSKINGSSCHKQIIQLQQLLDKNAFKSIINAENHTVMGMDNIFSLSGTIHFPDNLKISHFQLSLADVKHDCRLLNQLDHITDRYTCVLETEDSSDLHWNGKINALVYLKGSRQAFCDFELAFENQQRAAILDLDLALLCQ